MAPNGPATIPAFPNRTRQVQYVNSWGRTTIGGWSHAIPLIGSGLAWDDTKLNKPSERAKPFFQMIKDLWIKEKAKSVDAFKMVDYGWALPASGVYAFQGVNDAMDILRAQEMALAQKNKINLWKMNNNAKP